MLRIFPENPGPNEKVQASLSSSGFNLDRSYITWFLNEMEVLKGQGKKSYGFKSGDIGKETTIKVVIKSPSGNILTQGRTVIPADVDLLWSAESTVSFNYKAKALAAGRTKVKITAVPHFIEKGKRIPASQLIYKWFLNNELRDEVSGFGRQSFEFNLSILAQNSEETRVEILNAKGNIKMVKSVSVPIVSPQVLLYEEHPLEGPRLNKAIINLTSRAPSQVDLRAEPYYFSPEELKYNWLVDGQEAKRERPHNILNLKIGEGFFGRIPINIRVENLNNVLQIGEKNSEINVQ
jgi:hypothetical protein